MVLSKVMMGIAVFDETPSVAERKKIVETIRCRDRSKDPSKKRDYIQMYDGHKMALSELVTKNSCRGFSLCWTCEISS